MPKPYPEEFRGDVAGVARNRGPDVTLEQVAADFGYHAVTDPHVAAEQLGACGVSAVPIGGWSSETKRCGSVWMCWLLRVVP